MYMHSWIMIIALNWIVYSSGYISVPQWSSGSGLDHRSLSPVFESRRGHVWRLFHLSLCLISFGGCSAHLAYHVHKSGCKTSIIIIINHHPMDIYYVLFLYHISALKPRVSTSKDMEKLSSAFVMINIQVK